MRKRVTLPIADEGDNVTLIRQASNQRLLDAYQSATNDFAVVTRGFQENDSQQWHIDAIGGVGTLQQVHTGRYLDAYETDHDHSVVTRPAQNNDSQKWVLIPTGIQGAYTIQQLSTARYLYAHESESDDYSAVTRSAQYSDGKHHLSQVWHLTTFSDGGFAFKQLSTGSTGGTGGPTSRYLDAYQSAAHDFSAVTRLHQGDESQLWNFEPVGGVYTLRQDSTERYLDAYADNQRDYGVVTRESKRRPWNNAPSQCWIILDDRIRQASTGRNLDAYQAEDTDYRVVTRPSQGNPTQSWTFDQAPPPPRLEAVIAAGRGDRP